MKRVSPAEAAVLLSGGNALLVDVRSRFASSVGAASAERCLAATWAQPEDSLAFMDSVLFAAEGACPSSSLSRPLLFYRIQAYPPPLTRRRCPPGLPVVLIDTFGCRAESAAKALVSRASASVCFVDGGLQAWVAAGLPTTGDAAAALAPAVLERLSAAGEGDAPRGFSIPFRPKLLDVLAEGYTAADAQRDVLAGLSVGIIALSLSMALGIASDATPGAGLVTAVAAGFFVSLLGGSRVAIGGPTAAFIPIVVGVSHKYGIEGLSTCTVLSGGILMVMGALKLGKLIIKIPKPVITGCARKCAPSFPRPNSRDAPQSPPASRCSSFRRN